MSALTGYRISPQQAAWWKSQGQETLIYPNQLVIDPAGKPDASAIRTRLETLTAQEEILRTQLKALPGMALPIQIVEQTAAINFDSVNVDGSNWHEFAHATRTQTATGPLSVRLVCLENDRHLLVLSGHPAYLDVYSLELIAHELLGITEGQERLQYVDYAEWKHSLREDDPDSDGTAFWNRAAHDTPATLLPGLASSAALPIAIVRKPLPVAADLAQLQQTAANHGLTLQEFLFAAWSILLARLQGQNQLQLAWIDAGRGEGLEHGLGLYEQALPVQVEIDPILPLHLQASNLLQNLNLASGWRDFYDSTGKCALYFAFRQFAAPLRSTQTHTASGLDGVFSAIHQAAIGLECTVIGPAENRALQLALMVDRHRFNDLAIACITEQWQQLLLGLQDPAIAIGSIGLQGEYQSAVLAQQVRTPNIQALNIQSLETQPLNILDLIDRQVSNQPDARALADHQYTLTYRELAAHSTALAHELLRAGVTPGSVIGILLARENQAIVAMLAIMKAGCAYLPLDPAYPADRLAYMLQDSQAQIIITRDLHADLLPEGTRTLVLEGMTTGVKTHSATVTTQTLPEVDPQAAAYLIYTSGSTGKPKAVEITHANLSYSTQVRIGFYQEPVTAYLLLSSFAFDSSVAGIFWTLATGGLLVLPASGEELDLNVLANLISQHRISHSLSLPSLYETLLDYADRNQLASLSTWIVAGEACHFQVLQKHRAKVPAARLVNEYGPTEATVWATADILTDIVTDTDASANTDITIGRPIPGMQLLVVNDAGLPAAIGEPGEIHLGGATLARGYRGKPEQTAQAFITRPSLNHGERLYRTGDLARYRVDGRLDFLGRTDHQVKIRGYRIELAEIERVLQSHSEVREAAVIAQQHSDSLRLVAYVTDRHGYAPEARALASFLGDRLPHYMVPAAFVQLKSLPRTPNGKLDLNALPDPDSTMATQADYVAPRTDMEADLAAICADVLHRDRVGVMDDFFRIGGDSILSLQIVARASQRGIRINAKQVFECETIARLAEVAVRMEPEKLPQTQPAEQSTQANFALAGLGADELDDLLAELNSAD